MEKRGSRYTFRYSAIFREFHNRCKLLNRLEARVGIEPTHKGFADLARRFRSVCMGLQSPIETRVL